MKNRLHCFVCRGLVFLLTFVILTRTTYAQHVMLGNKNVNAEIGINFGPTFFLGDLGGHRGYGSTFIKDVNLPLTKFMKGFFVSVYPNEWLGFRIAGQYTYVEGQDRIIGTNGSNELFRKYRNLDFRSDIWEVYTAVEFFPLMILKQYDVEYQPKLRPYIFAGVGVFHFNPQGSLTDANGNKTWQYLHPLHTEGEGFPEYPDRKPYPLTQLNIPMGAGLKYLLSDKINLGVELLYRKTFTDYVDDVSTTYIDRNLFNKYLSPADANIALQINDKSSSNYTRTDPGLQRGNPKNNDAYFSFLLKIGIRLSGNFDNDNDKRAVKHTRCPARF
jgi:opacity protein-like surface antigen